MISAPQRPAVARLAAAPAALALAGGLAGAALMATAWATSPLVVLGLVAGAAVVALTLERPEIGVAAAFVLVPLSNLGLTGRPPWLLTSVWALALFLLGLWRHPHERPPLTFAVLASVIAAAVTFVVGGASPDGYPELRAAGVGLLYFAAVALLIRTRRQVEWALGGVVCAVLLVGLLALEERVGGAPITSGFFTSGGELVGRVSAGFGHPNQLGGFLVLLLPFAVASALLSPRLRPLAVAAVGLGAFAVYASFSRGALIALAAIPLAFVRGRHLMLLVPLLAVIVVLATPGLVRERFATLTESGSEVATRVDFWATAAHIWQEQPVLGAGLGRFPDAYATARIPGRGFLPNTLGEPPPHAHNLFLHALSTQGLLGFLALLAVLAAALAAARRLRRQPGPGNAVLGSAFLAGIVALLIHNQFDVTLLEGTGMYFWALLGLLAGCAAHLDRGAEG